MIYTEIILTNGRIVACTETVEEVIQKCLRNGNTGDSDLVGFVELNSIYDVGFILRIDNISCMNRCTSEHRKKFYEVTDLLEREKEKNETNL